MAISGSNAAQIAGYTPMQMPIGTARRVASRKPAKTRPVLARMSWKRIPLSAMDARERNTAWEREEFPSTSPREDGGPEQKWHQQGCHQQAAPRGPGGHGPQGEQGEKSGAFPSAGRGGRGCHQAAASFLMKLASNSLLRSGFSGMKPTETMKSAIDSAA